MKHIRRPDGGIGMRRYYCLLGNLTESQYGQLKRWIRKFQKEDPFCSQISTNSYDEWDDGRVKLSHDTDIQIQVILLETAADKPAKIKDIESGNHDFENAIAVNLAAVLNDLYNPYRILYEIWRKAEFFRSVEHSAKTAKHDVKRGHSNTTNPHSKSNKKGGAPFSKRLKWIMGRHDEGSSPLEICEKWNKLSYDDRKKIDPSDTSRYDLSDEEKTKSKEKVRGVIRREKERRTKASNQ